MSEIFELREKALHLVNEAQSDMNRKDFDRDIEAQVDRKLEEARRLEAQARKLQEANDFEVRMNEIDPSRRPTERGRSFETAENHAKTHSAEFRDFLRTGKVGKTMLETRVDGQLTTPGTAGGYTVPIDFYDAVTISLRQYSPLGDPALTSVLETDEGRQLQMPTLNDTASFGFIIGEGVQANSANAMVFGQKTLTAYTFSSDVVLISHELLEDTAVNLESILVDQVGLRIGRIMAQKFTVGSGSSEPTGIVTAVKAQNAANVANSIANTVIQTANSVANTVISPINFDDVYNLFHATEPAYRSHPKFRWAMADTTLLTVRKLKDNYGRYLLDSNYQMANQPEVMLGKEIYINQAMANATTSGNIPILLGDGAGFFVRKVRGLQVQRLVERYADYRQVGYVFFVRADSNLLDARSMYGLAIT